MTIPFTQYLMPDGRQVKVLIDRPPRVEKLAHKVIDLGGVFEIEVLTTGEVSITCELPKREETIAHKICPNGPNGPNVPDTVDAVVRAASAYLLASNADAEDCE